MYATCRKHEYIHCYMCEILCNRYYLNHFQLLTPWRAFYFKSFDLLSKTFYMVQKVYFMVRMKVLSIFYFISNILFCLYKCEYVSTMSTVCLLYNNYWLSKSMYIFCLSFMIFYCLPNESITYFLQLSFTYKRPVMTILSKFWPTM